MTLPRSSPRATMLQMKMLDAEQKEILASGILSDVTVAANLDVDAWADVHGYPRLVGSLNPVTQPPMPAQIYQRHYIGGEDRIVPKEIVARGPINPNTLIVIPSYDHHCCWAAIWPAVLTEVERATGSGH